MLVPTGQYVCMYVCMYVCAAITSSDLFYMTSNIYIFYPLNTNDIHYAYKTLKFMYVCMYVCMHVLYCT